MCSPGTVTACLAGWHLPHLAAEGLLRLVAPAVLPSPAVQSPLAAYVPSAALAAHSALAALAEIAGLRCEPCALWTAVDVCLQQQHIQDPVIHSITSSSYQKAQ